MFLIMFFVMLISRFFTLSSEAHIHTGFYISTCPKAEATVQRVVKAELATDPRKAAALLRLHFHDCFVQGCDGSILLMHEGSEIHAPGNAGVRGFDIIAKAKAELERICPGVVSCADVVALAARDSVLLTKGPFYDVPTGRRDGLVSTAEDAANLPDPQESFESLRSKFREQGFSDRELVLLSAGAHTIGRAACFFVAPRLDAGDPSISPDFFPVLRSRCPKGGDVNVRVPLDWAGEFGFDGHIFRNIQSGRSVLASDAVLYRDDATKGIIDGYVNSSDFAADFAGAMVKLGELKVKTGVDSEIRRVCNVTG